MIRPRAIGLLSTIVTLLCACSDDSGGHGSVVVGALYNLTGAQAELDIPSSRGAQLAVDQANAAGGVLGRTVELALEDGETNPQVIATRTAELLERFGSMPALIGLSDTDMVLAAAPLAASDSRLFVTSGATSPQLPGEVPTWLFLACFGDNVQAAAGAEWAFEGRAARTASILYSTSSSYTTLLQGYFRQRFEELGGQVVSVSTYTPEDLSADDVKEVATADIIYLSAQPEDGLAATQLLRAAGHDEAILGGDGLDSDTLWAQHPEIADVFFTTHAYLGADSTDPAVKAFRQAYEAAYPGTAPDAFSALGYDTARLVLSAIDTADDHDPEAVRAALAATKNFNGVTGTISYTDDSRIPMKSVTILEITGGKRRFVEQRMPTKVPPP